MRPIPFIDYSIYELFGYFVFGALLVGALKL